MVMLLEVKELKKYYPVTKGLFKRTVGYIKAVDGVDFSIPAGQTFGLVGESGCGKTTVGKSILRLIEPTAGQVFLEENDILKMSKKELLQQRKNIQIIFQDPYGSLNPRMTIGDIIAEPILKHKLAKGVECINKVIKILDTVGLSSREMKKYPHEFSGGQRQRIAIARALAVNPKLIVCDEPVSSLDVSVQAQILNLMKELQKEFKVAYLFISHSMPVVRHVSQRVGVMYLGKLVEVADSNEIFTNPIHPYTKALMSAIPTTDPINKKKRIILTGEVPDLINTPQGCLFNTRCPNCVEICKNNKPSLQEVSAGHMVACHLIE